MPDTLQGGVIELHPAALLYGLFYANTISQKLSGLEREKVEGIILNV